MVAALRELAEGLNTAAACRAVGLSRATAYRLQNPRPVIRSQRRVPWALSPSEEDEVLGVLHSERFVDWAPEEIVATLLDEGVYHCSARTMYRLLERHDEVRERRAIARRGHHPVPALVADRPNQVWSWDITKLRGPRKWQFFYLYVILDIFSRYLAGWMVAQRESAELARQLILATCDKHGIIPGQLTLHADRGAPMTSKAVAELLADLDVVRSLSRPRVSNDNPYSEAQFKTIKYCREFPGWFGSEQDVRAFMHPFVDWYNNEHRHSGIAMLTPATVHFGRADEVLQRRHEVLLAAYAAHPDRFSRPPRRQLLPEHVWINRPNTFSVTEVLAAD